MKHVFKKRTKWSQRYRGEYLNIFRACSIWPIYAVLFFFFISHPKTRKFTSLFPAKTVSKDRKHLVARAQGTSHNSINGVVTRTILHKFNMEPKKCWFPSSESHIPLGAIFSWTYVKLWEGTFLVDPIPVDLLVLPRVCCFLLFKAYISWNFRGPKWHGQYMFFNRGPPKGIRNSNQVR